jgi:hypothetical protein
MPSYSVRCLFRWLDPPSGSAANTYEERITLWRAASIDAAIGLAETEAGAYAKDGGCEYLGYCQAFALANEVALSGVEVFSLLRDSELEPSMYLNAFFDTGAEREQ